MHGTPPLATLLADPLLARSRHLVTWAVSVRDPNWASASASKWRYFQAKADPGEQARRQGGKAAESGDASARSEPERPEAACEAWVGEPA